MATKYVNSGAAGTASGDSWTDAYTTLGAAVTAGADLIKVHNAHSEALGADATYTLTVDTRIVCVDKDSSDALSTGAIVGNQTTNRAITFSGAFELRAYGVSFRNGTDTTTSKSISFGTHDGAHCELEACDVRLAGGSSSRLILGGNSTASNAYVGFSSCTLRFGSTSVGITPQQGTIEFDNFTIDAAGSAPATLFRPGGTAGPRVSMTGCDLSHVTGTLVGDNGTGTGTSSYVFANCALGSGVTPKAAATSILNKGNTSVWMYDCNAGDVHYGLYHGDAFGETTAVADYYYTTGGASIGSGFSWKIVTTANCSYWNPYVSPWFYRAHDDTSAVTLSIEGLRLSTTVIQDDEVWGEFSYKGTAGSVITTVANDRQDVGARANGTAGADQTSSATYADWTNGTSSHSAFELATTSTVTPSEIGVLGARVLVGEPSLTVYIDPQIRVA